MKITIYACVNDHGYRDDVYRLKCVTYDNRRLEKPRVKLAVRGCNKDRIETRK